MNQWQNIQSYLDDISDLIRERVPVKSGDLKNSITSNFTQDEK